MHENTPNAIDLQRSSKLPSTKNFGRPFIVKLRNSSENISYTLYEPKLIISS